MSNLKFEYSENFETIDLQEIVNFLENIQPKPSKETSSEKKPSPPSPKLKQSRKKVDKLNIEKVNSGNRTRNFFLENERKMKAKNLI